MCEAITCKCEVCDREVGEVDFDTPSAWWAKNYGETLCDDCVFNSLADLKD